MSIFIERRMNKKNRGNEDDPSPGVREPSVCRACSSLPFPVHRAAAYGHVECLRMLLEKEKRRKTDLFLDLDGRTPLHVAAEAGELPAMKYLIENTKISPYHRDAGAGETCAHSAVRSNSTNSLEVIQYLLSLPACKGGRHPLAHEKDTKGGNTVLHSAVMIGNNDIALWLLQTFGQGIANLPNKLGQLALHIAAARGNLELIRIATKYDSQMVHKRDGNGATSAFYAARGGDLQCLKYLIEKARADVRTVTSRGHSLMHVASMWGRIEVVQWLLSAMKKNAVYQKSQDNATPFHCAAYGGQTAILKLLLIAANGKKKYLTSSADKQGNTPIHLAAMNDHFECAQYLLESGADPKLKNKGGQSAIDLAARNGHHRVVWLLSNYKKGKGKLIYPLQLSPLPVLTPGSISTSGYGSYASPMTPPPNGGRLKSSMTWAPWSVQQGPINLAEIDNHHRSSWNDLVFRRKKQRHSTAPMFYNGSMVLGEKESITGRVLFDGHGGPHRFFTDKKVQTEFDPLSENVLNEEEEEQMLRVPFFDDEDHPEDARFHQIQVLPRHDLRNDLNEHMQWREAAPMNSDSFVDDRGSTTHSLSLSTEGELRDLVDEEECIAATEHIDRALEETTDGGFRKATTATFPVASSTGRRRLDSPRPSDLGPPMVPPLFYDSETKQSKEIHTHLFAAF